MKAKRFLTRPEEALLKQVFLERGRPVNDDPTSLELKGWIFDSGWNDGEILEAFSALVPPGVTMTHVSGYRRDMWGNIMTTHSPQHDPGQVDARFRILEKNVRNLLQKCNMVWTYPD